MDDHLNMSTVFPFQEISLLRSTNWPHKLLSFCLNWLSGQGGGVIQGTASEAVLVVLLAARDKVVRRVGKDAFSKLVVYCSDQTHCSLQKACQVYVEIDWSYVWLLSYLTKMVTYKTRGCSCSVQDLATSNIRRRMFSAKEVSLSNPWNSSLRSSSLSFFLVADRRNSSWEHSGAESRPIQGLRSFSWYTFRSYITWHGHWFNTLLLLCYCKGNRKRRHHVHLAKPSISFNVLAKELLLGFTF